MQSPSVEIPKTPFRFIFFAIKPYWKWLSLVAFFLFLSEFFNDLTSFVFRGLIDTANATSMGLTSTGSVALWVLAYPGLVLLSTLSLRCTGYLLNKFSVRARTGAIKTLFEYISLHSLSYFNNRFSGALSNRVTTVAGNVSRLVNQFIWSILSFLFSFVVTFALIASSNLSIALAFLAGFIVLIPFNVAITKHQMILSEKMAETGATLRGQVIDIVTNISAVQQYARRIFEINRLQETIDENTGADIKSNNYRETVLLINNVLVVLFVGSIIWWTFTVWREGGMSVGEFVMVATLAGGFIRVLSHIGQNLNHVMESYGEIKDGLREISLPHDVIDSPNAMPLVVKNGEIELTNVVFAYDRDAQEVLKGLSLKIYSGEKVGVVGTSGAGKTTFVKLLLRQHDITSGNITIDGQDIRDVTQESLREHIAVVPQEPILFHRTIKENIQYGKLDATDDEIIEVAKKAQAHDFITVLPLGYDSLVGERGVKLSVGQRQRVAIARAILKNAPILILDEATSALDSESEVAVQKALHNLMENKTVIAIAHRLSTLREMDRILVFENGAIVEEGSHATLLKKNGTYATFWNHQAGGFIDEDSVE